MVEKILVAFIGLLATWYLVMRFYHSFKGKNAECCCGSCVTQCEQRYFSMKGGERGKDEIIESSSV